MPRGELWLPEELKVLFKVVQVSCDLDILMSSRHANAVEWEPIAMEMARFGFRRTWQQCRAKWKALRRAFHLENEHKLRHGTHSDKRPPSYSIMLKLWQKAGRPVFRDQHMLRNRSRHLSLSCSGLGRQAFYSHALSGVRQYLSGDRGGIPRIASLSLAVNPEGKVKEDEVESLRLGCDAVLPASRGDSMSVLCAGLGRGVLEEEEDVKPKILHPLPETSRSDGEPAAAEKPVQAQKTENRSESPATGAKPPSCLALESRQVLESHHTLESRRGPESRRLLESHRTLESRQVLESRRTLESHRALESRRTLESHRALETRRTLKSHRALESRRTLESHRALESRHTLESHRALESRRVLESRHTLESRRVLESLRMLESRQALESRLWSLPPP